MEENKNPGVGVAVLVFRDGKILLGEDLTKCEKTFYGVPGGHWESGESLSEARRREVREEAGIKIENLKLISLYDFFREDKNKSYVSIGFKANYKSGELKDESENTRKNWGWFPMDNLPEPLFPPDEVLIKRSKTGVIWEDR